MTTTKTMTARTVRQPKNHKKIHQLVDHTISLMTSILKEKNIERMSNTFDVTHTHTHCAVHLLTQASLFSACRFIRTFSQHSGWWMGWFCPQCASDPNHAIICSIHEHESTVWCVCVRCFSSNFVFFSNNPFNPFWVNFYRPHAVSGHWSIRFLTSTRILNLIYTRKFDAVYCQ